MRKNARKRERREWAGQLSDAVSRCVSLFVFEVSHKMLSPIPYLVRPIQPFPSRWPPSWFIHHRRLKTQALFFASAFLPRPRRPSDEFLFFLSSLPSFFFFSFIFYIFYCSQFTLISNTTVFLWLFCNIFLLFITISLIICSYSININWQNLVGSS